MKRAIFSFSLLFFFIGKLFASVADSDCKHNLSYRASHPGVDILATEASGETQVCKFCHIPHGALVTSTTQYPWYDTIYPSEKTTGWVDGEQTWRLPLIGHQLTNDKNAARVSLSTGIWQTSPDYLTSVTISTWAYGPESADIPYVIDPDAIPGSGDESLAYDWMPSGSSRICFSCHDGSIPIGNVRTSTGGVTNIDMQDTSAGGNKLTAEDKLGTGSSARFASVVVDPTANTSFASKHPMEHGFYSFYMTQDVIDDPRAPYSYPLKELAQIKGTGALDKKDFAQCTACHDPHFKGSYSNGSKQFWLKPNQDPKYVCWGCHQEF